MPFATHAGVRLYWKLDGEATKPPILLLHSIGTDMGSWDRALPHLLAQFRVLRMDARGHGASDATPGEYDLDLLARDAMAVMDAAGIETAVVCGVSLGGMISLTLATQEHRRVKAVVAACTSPKMDSEAWRSRIAAVQAGGTAAIADAALGRFFSPAFAKAHPEVVESARAELTAMSAEGYASCGAAIRDMDLRDSLKGIAVPVLVIGGERDVSTPFPDHGRLIAEGVPGAQTTLLDAAHLAQVEVPGAFAAAVRGFVSGLNGGDAVQDAAQTLFEAGLVNRRKVLGDEWVDRALARRTPFNSDFQAMITRIAWQEIWGRPGLDHRTRRLLVLAITVSLGRWEEFRMHVKVGLEQGGFTIDELKETLMQTGIYAGVPVANTGFAEAAEVMAALATAPKE
ncbi:3-oxoadipate enol-lactonase [Caulobacter sp. S45]|uniref:bifunctional 3-oxoadipate enol-lactonase/4-carboxymuconolactone decarboxylase PcaDC n=1 Tax=Caulobacter sp. S45 TaxID=1641861 RepID=UPI00131CD3D9|nr:3-oxoadipate enol-lactonase [Caulobacter sp. S45]